MEASAEFQLILSLSLWLEPKSARWHHLHHRDRGTVCRSQKILNGQNLPHVLKFEECDSTHFWGFSSLHLNNCSKWLANVLSSPTCMEWFLVLIDSKSFICITSQAWENKRLRSPEKMKAGRNGRTLHACSMKYFEIAMVQLSQHYLVMVGASLQNVSCPITL